MASGCGKYSVVHEFSDITKEAYRNVLQDIVNVYMKRNNNSESITAREGISESMTKKDIISFDNYIIDKSKFKDFDKTRNELTKLIWPVKDIKDENTSDLDGLAKEFLDVILCKRKFSSIDFGKISEKIINMHDPVLKDVIALRLQAMRLYFNDEIEECVNILREALHKSSEDNKIANWISNDIAIDLRNMISLSGEKNNSWIIDNEGQKSIGIMP